MIIKNWLSLTQSFACIQLKRDIFCPSDLSLQSQEGELFREEVAEFWCVSPCALIETNCDDWEGGVLTPEVLVDVLKNPGSNFETEITAFDLECPRSRTLGPRIQSVTVFMAVPRPSGSILCYNLPKFGVYLSQRRTKAWGTQTARLHRPRHSLQCLQPGACCAESLLRDLVLGSKDGA